MIIKKFVLHLMMELRKALKRKILKKKGPGFWHTSNVKVEIDDVTGIYIDVRNTNHAHLGDQLFFIATFLNFRKKKLTFLIDKGLEDFYSCFDVSFTADLPEYLESSSLYLCSLKSHIDPLDKFHSKFKYRLAYDLTDNTIEKPLYTHIYDTLIGGIGENTENDMFDRISDSEKQKVLSKFGLSGVKFYVFNDFLYSRTFMRPFLQNALHGKLKEFTGDGAHICYVGGAKDAMLDSNLTRCVNTDIRGKTSLSELLAIIASDNCKGFIGFDNAVMHIHLLFNKKAIVKFRGRFTKKARRLHFRSINCAMNAGAKDNITYI